MSNPIVVCGSLSDVHVRAVHEGLVIAGHKPLVLDAQKFPKSQKVTLGNEYEDIWIDGALMNRPAAVYVRSLYQTPISYGAKSAEEDMHRDWRLTLCTYQERNTLLTSILHRWEKMEVPIYNPISVHQSITKPFQMALLSREGLPVPRTIWTNDPGALREFAENQHIVYKPVAGGATTRHLTDNDLTSKRLDKLSAAPVTFQELLLGDDIRVYLLNGKIIARLKIITDALDFRQNEEAIEPISLPVEVDEQCIQAAKILGLRFTGMDLKGDSKGKLRILELNPSPMFLGFDARAGSDILGDLVNALLSHL